MAPSGRGAAAKRILYVSTSTTVGGAEKTLHTLATLIDPANFQVAGIVSLKPPGVYSERLKAMGFQTFSLGVKKRVGLKDIERLAVIIRETRPEIVHALMFQAIQLCRAVKKRGLADFKLVSSPRITYRTRPRWSLWLDRFMKGADDLLIAESDSSRGFLIRRLGYDPRRVRTIHNGVEMAGWSISKLERQKKRIELRLAAGDILIGSVGRLDEQKGHRYLLQAITRLKDLPLRCVILGEGPRRRHLEAQIRRNHLERHVWLIGEREELPSWFSTFDIFVLPSLWEGFPNALLEAMAIGLPVVASAVDGVLEAVEGGKNGLLVPPKSVPDLVKALRRLASDPAERKRLGSEAQRSVSDRFTLLEMIAAYESAYAEV